MTVTQGIISWAIIAAMLAAGMPANPDAGDADTGTPDTGDIDTGDVESGESGADTGETDTGEPEYYDYHGYNFKIANLMSDDGTDWTVDELNGSIVNDAIYERNRRVEDMYNIYMTEIPATLDDVRGSVLSGEDEYDIVDLGISDLVRLATERMILTNLTSHSHTGTTSLWTVCNSAASTISSPERRICRPTMPRICSRTTSSSPRSMSSATSVSL